jgi:hypothetical protein
MSDASMSRLVERKALLRARAELDRTRLSFALGQVRAVLAPPRDANRMASIRPTATMLIGVLAPLFGANRVARGLRFASFALTAYRIARNWRRTA